MAETTARVEGLSELLKALDALPLQLERNVVRQGLREGSRVIVQDLGGRIVAVSRTGRMARSVKMRSRTINGLPTVLTTIGDKNAYYAHIVEKGAAPHDIRPRKRRFLFFGGRGTRLVRHPGFAGRWFVKGAYDAQALRAVGVFKKYATDRIVREWNKLAPGKALP
jgi:hypothetical protein